MHIAKSERVNRFTQLFYHSARKILFEIFALFTQKGFYCRALAGQSSYSICINCDRTVSCNCQDYDGKGIIGDLHINTLEEVFANHKANDLRFRLAFGKLPLLTCTTCPEHDKNS